MLHRHELRMAEFHSEEIADMIARVIHLGADDCHRLMVLRSAGYAVEVCPSMVQLESRLATGDVPDAVLMSDGEDFGLKEAMVLARTYSSNPVILFQSSNKAYEDSGFDLVVPCLTPPEVWLNDVDMVIEKHRAVLGFS